MAKRATRTRRRPATIRDLTADPGNPRGIDRVADDGLGVSLEEFGDLSGITYNLTTRELVAGHQRVRKIREQHGDELEIRYTSGPSGSERGVLVTPAGDEFGIRLVEWTREKQHAANLAANNRAIQGHDLEAELRIRLVEVKADDAELYDSLLLDRLEATLDADENGSVHDDRPGAPDDEVLGRSYHTLSCQLTDAQHEAISAAVERAKKRREVNSLAEALAVIARDYKPRTSKRSGREG